MALTNAEIRRRYYARHKERSKEQCRRWKTNNPEFRVWQNMRNRCNNPKVDRYKNYGGRGIKVCARWQESYAAFLSDMGRRPSGQHSLDRIDNNQGYSPKNCRWAMRHDQARNKSNNHVIAFRGRSLCVNAWSIELGLPRQTIWRRIKRNLPIERVLAC